MTVMETLRIIFAGTPDFAAAHLAALLTSEHQVVGVFTQPNRPAGRGNKVISSPVKMLADQHGIAVFQPESLKLPESQRMIENLQADIMVVVAYGLILPSKIIDLLRLGCINVHGSLLPRWRGAAPIQRAIWAGDRETGITIMQMDAGLDTGDILHVARCPISDKDTSLSLYAKLAPVGVKALLTTLKRLVSCSAVAKPQPKESVTYAHKLTKEEARLNWHSAATQLERSVRAFNPWPISYFAVDDHIIRVWKASVLPSKIQRTPGEIITANKDGVQVATSDAILQLELLQLAGKKVMTAQALLNARPSWFKPGAVLPSADFSL